MFKRLSLSVYLILLSITSLAQIKVAILPATDKTSEIKYVLKLALQSSITTAISLTDGYEAYDRVDLSSILDEQSFQRTGMVSDAEIHLIGEMTGASYVLITEAALYDDEHLYATAKIVNVESAKIEKSAIGMMNVGNPDKLLADCKALTDKLLLKSNVTNKPNNAQAVNKSDIGNDHEYVDLGLSVKWATCNVGASQPEVSGDYFAWGETETDAKYNWKAYKYCNGTYKTMTKYCSKSSYGYNGFTDTKTTLDTEDDVVHVKWGGDWRMPTEEEFYELLNNCNWAWATQKGVKGYKVISRKDSSRSIFLPVTGYYYDSNLNNTRSDGYYWSCSLKMNTPNSASCLRFNSGYHNKSYYDRRLGFTIRPVCP